MTDAQLTAEGEQKRRIYTASKTRHAPLWKERRECGFNVISTWIDEAGAGESASMVDLWIRCVREASEADALIVYAEDGDVLKGGLVEVGAALASGKPVYAVGPVQGSWVEHPLVLRCSTLDGAFDMAYHGVWQP